MSDSKEYFKMLFEYLDGDHIKTKPLRELVLYVAKELSLQNRVIIDMLNEMK